MTATASVFDALRAAFGEGVFSPRGEGLDAEARARPESLYDALKFLKEKHDFNMLVDLSAVDWKGRDERFELSYRLMSLDAQTGMPRARFTLKVNLRDGQPVPRSAKELWPAADWLERELWDMFGVPFADRPGLKRILMYDGFVGHPLRKDYPIHKRQPLIGPASGERADNPSFNAEVPTVTAD